MSKSDTAGKTRKWWGDYFLDENQSGKWELGPTTIWLSRSEHEWRVAYWSEQANYTRTTKVTIPASETGMQRFIDQHEKEATVSRYVFKKTTNQLSVRPLLADRAVIVRPETPFYVFPGEEIMLYFASPAWVRFEAGPLRKALIEIPTLRPSDTWFGPSTRVGELCYSIRTLARLQFEPLMEIEYRVITPVRVRNRAADTLLLDRFQVLVQYLSIYESNNALWTPTVTIEREKSGDLAAMEVGKGAPKDAGAATLVQAPREKAHTSLIFRAFGELFS